MNLPDPCHFFDLPRIRQECSWLTLRFEKQVPSTNCWARQANDPASLTENRPVLYLTECQTAGRGRGNHRWFSGPGSLTFTLLLSTGWAASDVRRRWVSLAAGCGLCEALAPQGMPTALKWPNDVMLKDRKLAGVLIESVGTGRLAIGCGLNVNNSISGVPGAIAVNDYLGKSVDLTQVTIDCVTAVHQQIAKLQETSPQGLLQAVRSRDWLANRRVLWSDGDRREACLVRGIADDGGLIVRGAAGEKTLYSGSVRPLT